MHAAHVPLGIAREEARGYAHSDDICNKTFEACRFETFRGSPWPYSGCCTVTLLSKGHFNRVRDTVSGRGLLHMTA
jgi:hypothetical protein